MFRRLIPLGCVRAAIDDEGRICVAREPLLDAYFGREVALAERAPTPEAAARVVVQPDFSVIVIGLNPAPAAELRRSASGPRGAGAPGAMVLKITRESVVKAVSHGLKPAEIVARLKRHASNEVPTNVLRRGPGLVELGATGHHLDADRAALPRSGHGRSCDGGAEDARPSGSTRPWSPSIRRS